MQRPFRTTPRPLPLRGFTLVELLVVIAIIAALTGASIACILKMRTKAKEITEINAGKNLITAYHLAASDNGGIYLPGMDRSVNNLNDEYGQPIPMLPTMHRWPYRLAPYLGNKLDGSILLEGNKKYIAKYNKSMYTYYVSTFPALGMNTQLVGGYKLSDGSYEAPDVSEIITNENQGEDGHFVVFLSGGDKSGNSIVEGYNTISSPKGSLNAWSDSSTQSDNPKTTGNISFRHSGKAVCAFLDGSVSTLGKNELSDMRLWSRKARQMDDKNYTPQLSQ